MGKVKLVYQDNNSSKILFGFIDSEDNLFIKIKAEDGTIFRLNKNSVISIKEVKNGS